MMHTETYRMLTLAESLQVVGEVAAHAPSRNLRFNTEQTAGTGLRDLLHP